MAGQQTITAVITADSAPFKKSMVAAGKSTETFSKSLGKMGKVAGVAFAAAAVGIGAFAVTSLKAAAEAEAVSRSLANAAKNAKLFGTSKVQIDSVTSALTEHSGKLAELTGIDDEYLDKLKTGWLSVPNIVRLGITGINDLSEIAVNIAAQAGKDSEGVAQALARVFSNPEQAMKRLQKAGVYLSESQKTAYDKILKTNGTIAAQNYLIDQLKKKYEGAAAAAANPFERLKVVFENLQETVGAALLPSFEKLVTALTPIINQLAPILATAFDALTPVFDALTAVMPAVGKAFAQLAVPLKAVMGFIGQLVIKMLPLFNKLWAILAPLIDKLLPPLLELLDAVLTPLIALVGEVIDAFAPLIDEMLPIMIELWKTLLPVIAPIMKLLSAIVMIVVKLFVAFAPLISAVFPIFIKLLEVLLPPLIKVIDRLTDGLLWVIDFITPGLEAMTKGFKDFQKGLEPVFSWVNDVADALGIIFGYSGKTVNVKAKTSIVPAPNSTQGNSGAPVNITINASSVDTSVATGRAVATALQSYYRTGGRLVV